MYEYKMGSYVYAKFEAYQNTDGPYIIISDLQSCYLVIIKNMKKLSNLFQ